MTLSMGLSLLLLATMVWALINPFTLEYQQEKAAEMIDNGKRVKLTHKWYGWRVVEVEALSTPQTNNKGVE